MTTRERKELEAIKDYADLLSSRAGKMLELDNKPKPRRKIDMLTEKMFTRMDKRKNKTA